MDGEDGTAEGDNHKDNPFGKIKGRRYPQTDKIGEPAPEIDHHGEECQGDQMNSDFALLLQKPRHLLLQNIDSGMGLAPFQWGFTT